MKEENKVKKSRICILLGILFLLIIAPFVYPSILRGLIKIKLFSSVNHYVELISPFSNMYTLIIVIAILAILFIVFVDKIHPIKEFFMGVDLKVKIGDKEIGINSKDLIKPTQEIFNKSVEIEKEESNEAKLQVKNALKNKNTSKKLNSKEEEIKELKEIVDNIRFFSAYNNTNYICSELLLYLLERKSISRIEFEEKLEYYYSSRIKDVKGKRKRECVKRKVEEKIFNYKYLDIIEISDDNEYVILTDLGVKFVKDYLMKGVDGNV